MGNKKKNDKKIITRSQKKLKFVKIEKNIEIPVNRLTRSKNKSQSPQKLCIENPKLKRGEVKKVEEKKSKIESDSVHRVARSSSNSKKTSQLQPKPCIENSKSKPAEVKKIVKLHQFYKLNNFTTNAIVLAKQKYSFPWPARVLEVKKEKVSVYFFGDKRTGFVDASEIYDFVKSFAALRASIVDSKKPRAYLTGIREIELLLGLDGAQ